jgi:hypothetical protein
VRLWYGFYLTGYVVHEHVHLLLSEQNTQCYLRGFRC